MYSWRQEALFGFPNEGGNHYWTLGVSYTMFLLLQLAMEAMLSCLFAYGNSFANFDLDHKYTKARMHEYLDS